MIYSNDSGTSSTYINGYQHNPWNFTSTATTIDYDTSCTNSTSITMPNWISYVQYVPPGEDLDFTADDMAKLKPKKPRISPKLYLEVEKELKDLDVIAEAERIINVR